MQVTRTWHGFDIAVRNARLIAGLTNQRQKVMREDGRDDVGLYRFRIVPAGVEEPCS